MLPSILANPPPGDASFIPYFIFERGFVMIPSLSTRPLKKIAAIIV